MPWKYRGTGFYPGIPARDLTDDEAEALGCVELLRAGSVYTHVKDKPAPAERDPVSASVESDSDKE